MTLDPVSFLLGFTAGIVFSAVFYFYKKPATPPQPPPPGPGIPPCVIPPDRVGNVLLGVYHPSRLTIYEDCNYGKGTVAAVRHESDGDYHIELNPDPDSPVQAKGNQYLICEITPYDQSGGQSGLNIMPPNVGDHVALYGPHVFDNNHNWAEIHPVWKILTL